MLSEIVSENIFASMILNSKRIKKIKKWYIKKFFLAYFYRIFIEEYLVIVCCVLINFNGIVFQGKQL